MPGGGAVSFEAEWARYDGLGGYDPRYVMNDGGYLLAAYLFPKRVGPGQFEILGKYARARFREGLTPDYNQKTTEVDLNYIIRQFNARLMIFFKDTSYTAVQTDDFPGRGRTADPDVATVHTQEPASNETHPRSVSLCSPSP